MKFVLLVSLLFTFALGDDSTNNICSGSVCIPSAYNKMDMPNCNNNDKGKLNVSASILLLDIYKINYDDFTMDLNVYFRFSWIENRLIVNDTSNGRAPSRYYKRYKNPFFKKLPP